MIIYAADDEHFMLEALTEAISEAIPSAIVRGFNRAKDLLEAFQKENADAVFVDIQMPVIDGITLAKKLIDIKKDINIVFVTSFDNYKADAMDIYASAYILKPVTKGKVLEAAEHLRYPVIEKKRRFRAVTFGNFTLYVDEQPVTFHRKKSAELLAYLVAKRGTIVSRAELTLNLYEDEMHSVQSRKKLDNAIRTLREDLEKVKASELLYKGSDGLAVNCEILEADLFDYIDGNKMLYQGQFMEQYSWGEFYKGEFANEK